MTSSLRGAAAPSKGSRPRSAGSGNRSIPGLLAGIYSSDGIKGTLLAVVAGIVAGLGAIGFRLLIGGFHWIFFEKLLGLLAFLGPLAVVPLPALGGLLVGLLVTRFAREAKGHGVPEVMDAVANNGGRIRARVSVVKALASSICIASGGSVGREGPIVQIGAAFGSTLGQRLRLSQDWIRTLVACGAAGGISATFNAPIAGVFFALEVILGRFAARHFSFVVISSVVAGAVGHMFLGDVPAFVIRQYGLVNPVELPLYALLGASAALVGFFFARFLYRVEDLFDWIRFPEYAKPVLGGLCVGLIGIYFPGVFGVGYESITDALMAKLTVQAALGLLVFKLLATSLTLGSGGSGGVFAPSLFLGAVFGAAFGGLVHAYLPGVTASPGAYAVVGMAAVFTGAAHAPITAILIVFEMTRDYKLILPLMIAVVISMLVTQSLSPQSIYTLKLLRRGRKVRPAESASDLNAISVGDVMTRDFPAISSDAALRDLAPRFEKEGFHGFPVLDAAGKLAGVITVSDVENALKKGLPPETPVGEVATRSVITAYPDQSVPEALLRLGAQEVGRIPVVSREDPGRLVGVLRRHDIVRAYTRMFGGGQERP